jgi:hypothetical protein
VAPAGQVVYSDLTPTQGLTLWNGSVQFNNTDGSNGTAYLRTDSAVTNPTGINIETWRPTQYTVIAIYRCTQVGAGYQTLVSLEGKSPTANLPVFSLRGQHANAEAQVQTSFGTATSHVEFVHPGFAQDDHWMYLAVTNDGDTIRLYGADLTLLEDVRLLAERNLPAVGVPMGEPATPAPLNKRWRLGSGTFGTGASQFNDARFVGQIAEVKIYEGVGDLATLADYVPVELSAFSVE